jgi:hypothetical protein
MTPTRGILRRPRRLAAVPSLRSLPDRGFAHREAGAVHLARPAGEGANLAMFDGAGLAKAIANQPDDIEAALAVHEAAMLPRSALAAADAHQVLALCLNARTLQSHRLL